MRGERGQAVRFDGQENNIHRPCGIERIHYARANLEIALRAGHAHAAFLHRPAVSAARKECNVASGLRHLGPDVGSDGARAGYGKFHPRAPASSAATLRRCTLPVAVRGMDFTM